MLLSALRVELGLELIAGVAGTERLITGTSVQKPGLALAGFTDMLEPGRVQIFGQTEINYLWSLPPYERQVASSRIVDSSPPAIIISRGADVPEQLVVLCNQAKVPLIHTGLRSSMLVEAIHKFLSNRLARTRSVHGVLVDVFGVGVLIIGKSGIGKSECGLELVMRGHRLVADDVVDISKTPPSTIIGSGNELIRHHMEIRGLGIINIKDLFGVSAIRERKRVEMVIALEDWEMGKAYDRLGGSNTTHELLGVTLPKAVIPVRPGRSLTSIVEVAARNQLLREMGHHSALDFQQRIQESLDIARRLRPDDRLDSTIPRELIDDDVE
ncbi:MAG: HPr(Ser) kinase/phosphatase [Myxococcota bacterium]|nr:HPr(Ser) kinase/phosphatase [Myxococcota bacterium]